MEKNPNCRFWASIHCTIQSSPRNSLPSRTKNCSSKQFIVCLIESLNTAENRHCRQNWGQRRFQNTVVQQSLDLYVGRCRLVSRNPALNSLRESFREPVHKVFNWVVTKRYSAPTKCVHCSNRQNERAVSAGLVLELRHCHREFQCEVVIGRCLSPESVVVRQGSPVRHYFFPKYLLQYCSVVNAAQCSGQVVFDMPPRTSCSVEFISCTNRAKPEISDVTSLKKVRPEALRFSCSSWHQLLWPGATAKFVEERRICCRKVPPAFCRSEMRTFGIPGN